MLFRALCKHSQRPDHAGPGDGLAVAPTAEEARQMESKAVSLVRCRFGLYNMAFICHSCVLCVFACDVWWCSGGNCHFGVYSIVSCLLGDDAVLHHPARTYALFDFLARPTVRLILFSCLEVSIIVNMQLFADD